MSVPSDPPALTAPIPASRDRPAGFAEAAFADGIIVTRQGWPGARWLNAAAGLAWLERDAADVAGAIATRTGTPRQRIATDLAEHAERRSADAFFTADRAEAVPAPRPRDAAWERVVALGELPVRLVVRDAAIAASLAGRLDEVPSSGAAVPNVELDGDGTSWEVRREGLVAYRGRDPVQGRSALMVEAARASRPGREVLAWLHAGAVEMDGAAVVLCGAGGRGKSTLTAALGAAGGRLLSDDLVPVEPRTLQATAVRMPVSLRAGGLAAVEGYLPPGADLRRHEQDGEWVTLWRPPEAMLVPRDRAVPIAALLFPAYTPGTAPLARALTPLERLEALVASWSSLPRTSSGLQRFASWLEAVPAWRLTYPDLESGLRLVAAVGRQGAAPPR